MIDALSGLIHGTPTQVGTFEVNLSATNTVTGTGTATLTLTINQASQVITLAPISSRQVIGSSVTLGASSSAGLP